MLNRIAVSMGVEPAPDPGEDLEPWSPHYLADILDVSADEAAEWEELEDDMRQQQQARYS